MNNYYVNKNCQKGGEHEVHKQSCLYLPKPENRIYLGVFNNCRDAIKEAKKHYSNIDGCFYCCKECHTR